MTKETKKWIKEDLKSEDDKLQSLLSQQEELLKRNREILDKIIKSNF